MSCPRCHLTFIEEFANPFGIQQVPRDQNYLLTDQSHSRLINAAVWLRILEHQLREELVQIRSDVDARSKVKVLDFRYLLQLHTLKQAKTYLFSMRA